MTGPGSPIPAGVLSAFDGLSPTRQAGGVAQSCGRAPAPGLDDIQPCDLDQLQVTVVTEAGTVTSVATATGLRFPTIDVVCGRRPMADAGAGEAVDKKHLQLKRDPARISIVATYAAQCGKDLHPGVVVQPQGGNEDICAPRKVGGTSVQLEAFRLPNGVEKGKVWLKGGSLLPAVSAIWDCVDDDTGSGEVSVSTASCGVRGAGPTMSAAGVTVRLHAEDKVSVEFKMPALFSREGDSEKEKEKEKKFAKSGLGHVQAIAHKLKEEGYEFKFSHNDDEFDLEEIQSALAFMQACSSLNKIIAEVARMWREGPAVKVTAGWFGKFEFKCLQSAAEGTWTRTFTNGKVERTIEGKVNAVLVDGSATGGCGVKVTVTKLGIDWLDLDYTLSLEVEGTIAGSNEWSAKRSGDAPWSSEPKRRVITGTLEVSFAAKGKCVMCGRVIGVELTVDSAINAEAVLDPQKGIGLQEAKLSSDPVVFGVSVWIGSTSEADFSYEQEMFPEKEWPRLPAPSLMEAEPS